ncbi:hypothetical protein [Angelakisella massiliensis]|uniref:hypothetical protein n=1 Tax=Angelakisella massiliensis TaxID=1871018 RepID=UPI0024B187F1|nr:hypothetical protein [Angelakisella massiliensis]
MGESFGFAGVDQVSINSKIAPDTSGTGALFISCGPECKWEGGNFGTNDADRCQGKVSIVQISHSRKDFLRRFGERIFPAEVVLILEKLCFAYDRNRNAVPGAPGRACSFAIFLSCILMKY